MRFGLFLTWLGVTACAACATLAPSASADEATAGPPITVRFPVAFETPYKLGSRPTLRSAGAAKAEEEALNRWNIGGRNGEWHPHPRVIVDNVRVDGRIRSSVVLSTSRAKGYWHIRQCYDAALPDEPELRGKMSIRFTIRHTGTAIRPVLVGKPTLDDPKVVDCIRQSFRKIRFPRTRRGDARATLDIAVSPGDAPMKRVEDPPVTPGSGTLALSTVQALVAKQAGDRIQRCFVDAATRVPGLWGRLVLRADVAPNGGIRELVEIESSFPDPQTTQCAIDAIRPLGLPPPQGGDVRVVIPIRFGQAR
jgi:hypothetical protein